MKQYFFSSLENAERVLLIFLIVWIAVTMIAFIRALSFCKKTKEPIGTQVNVEYGSESSAAWSAMSSISETLHEALQITEVVGIFVFVLEVCFFVLLMLS